MGNRAAAGRKEVVLGILASGLHVTPWIRQRPTSCLQGFLPRWRNLTSGCSAVMSSIFSGWRLAALGFLAAGVVLALDAGGEHWPRHLELYIAVVAGLAGLAFGAKGALLPIVGSVAFGVAWFLRVGASTNPATGDNETGIVFVVVVVASVVFGAASLFGAAMRCLLLRSRDDQQSHS